MQVNGIITFLQSIGTYYLGYKFLRLIYRLELWFNLLSGRIADWIFYIPIIKLIKLKVLTAFCGSDGLFGLNLKSKPENVKQSVLYLCGNRAFGLHDL